MMSLPLSVAKPQQEGRALICVPFAKMNVLGLHPGDTVCVAAGRKTHARVMPVSDPGETIAATIELAQNCGATWGDAVEISPATLAPINSVLVQLTGQGACSTQDLSEALFDLPLTEGDEFTLNLPFGRTTKAKIISIDPSPAGLFTAATTVSLTDRPKTTARYHDIGGLTEQIARVHEMVAVPLLRPDLFARLGVPAPRGVLFTGPPGSGKTLLARSIAAQTSAAFFQINGPEIVSKHYGESEAALRKVFQAANKEAPAIIFIDEIDAIAPRREALSGEKQVERRIVAQLLTLMDGLAERGRIIVMAATNLPDSLDPALRRPGRFDREIDFGPPDAIQRREILDIHLRNAPLAPDVDLAQIANDSHGYVGADLAALAREASLAALERAVKDAGGEDMIVVDQLFLTQADLRQGLGTTSPSILRDTFVESPVIRFQDIGGMEDAKSALTEAVIWPQLHKESFSSFKLRPVSGVLMSGPPGSGKTMLARALASEAGMNFIPVRPGKIMSQFLGDAERAISEIFTKARQSSPCLIFFDELDALAPKRTGKDPVIDRIVAQLLVELDGLSSNADVVVLAATNRANAIDPALTRPGRIDVVIPISLPDERTRHAILTVHCADYPLADDVDLIDIAARTDGASGATLATLADSAARSALRRALRQNATNPSLNAEDFANALQEILLSDQSRHADFIKGGQ